jgi:peptidoglycan/xylan/chitin deacetylase (PgdA/CDA1 family)
VRRKPPPLVLAYHSVGDLPRRDDRRGLVVSVGELRRHVAKLHSWGYELLTFGDLAARVAGGDARACAALTFDDGFADNATVLPGLGVPATVFAVSAWLGKAHPDLPSTRIVTVDELRALADGGVEIGAHSHTHRDLTRLGYQGALTELAESKRRLEKLLDRPVDVASYPYGRADAETLRACREAGFRAACRISGEGSWDDLHNLPRQDMNRGATMIGLWLKREDLYERMVAALPGRALLALARRLNLPRS